MHVSCSHIRNHTNNPQLSSTFVFMWDCTNSLSQCLAFCECFCTDQKRWKKAKRCSLQTTPQEFSFEDLCYIVASLYTVERLWFVCNQLNSHIGPYKEVNLNSCWYFYCNAPLTKKMIYMNAHHSATDFPSHFSFSYVCLQGSCSQLNNWLPLKARLSLGLSSPRKDT